MELLILLIIVWILPAAIGMKHANDKNRSGAKGFLVGILFGWFGILILVITLRERDKKTGFLR